MSHSVSRHLRIAIEEYDRIIRQFIPAYDEMLEQAAAAVMTTRPLDRVLDLGAGTGSLSERLLTRAGDARVELWDVDEAMLGQARARLGAFGERAEFRLQSFHTTLPPGDAVMASLALHHVRELDEKRALYRRIGAALRPGGVFVNADVTIPADAALAKQAYRGWADHLVASGIEEEQAWRHFEEWADEDRYFPLEDELAALAQAGLEAACPWRVGPATVTVAAKPR